MLSSEFINQKNIRGSINLPYYDNLNVEEKRLANENPVIAVAAYAWSKEAIDNTIRIYGRNGADDNSDAFRHACWNILMTSHIGYTWAEKWATAHEYGSSGLARSMDLSNNYAGRKAYSSGMSDSQCISKITSMVNSGQLLRIVNGRLVPTTGGRSN